MEGPAWEAFLARWHDVLGRQGKLRVSQLVQFYPSTNGGLLEVLPPELAEIPTVGDGYWKKVGLVLAKKVGVRYGDRNLTLHSERDAHTKQLTWWVEEVPQKIQIKL